MLSRMGRVLNKIKRICIILVEVVATVMILNILLSAITALVYQTSWSFSKSEVKILQNDTDCQRPLVLPLESSKFSQSSSSTCNDPGNFHLSNQSVISFSFEGQLEESTSHRRFLLEFLQKNIKKVGKVYPGYLLRIYTNATLNSTELFSFCPTICSNPHVFWCDIRNISVPKTTGMISQLNYIVWKYLPLGDPTVGVFLSRYLDSVASEREAAAVNDWLQNTSFPFQVMRDRKNDHNLAILGGLWGARNYLLDQQDAKVLQERLLMKSTDFGMDKQGEVELLQEHLFEPWKQEFVAYDSYHCQTWKRKTIIRAFPRKREGPNLTETATKDFVGNRGQIEYKDFGPCPKACRYREEWLYC